MLRYCVLLSMIATLGAIGCKNNQIVGDPFGRTRIPPPATGGAVAAPAPIPYYNQPQLGQPQPGQPPLSQPFTQPSTPPPASTPGSGLVPVPGAAPAPTYPGNTPTPNYPQGAPIYPQNPGAGLLPNRTNSIASAPFSLPPGRVQPIRHQPRLRPVPNLRDAAAPDSSGEGDSEFKSVVLIDEDSEGEPVIRIEEPTAASEVFGDDDSGDDAVELDVAEDDAFAEKAAPATFRKPDSRAIARTSSSSVLTKEEERESAIMVPGDTAERGAPRFPAKRSSETGRIDVADLPQADALDAKPQPKFRAMTTTPPARYGHAEDYDWLKGKLEYSAARKQWKLRYIPLDGNTDEYGGSVVLDSVDDSEYSAGDFVAVRGKLGERDPEVREFSTTYHVQQMKSM